MLKFLTSFLILINSVLAYSQWSDSTLKNPSFVIDTDSNLNIAINQHSAEINKSKSDVFYDSLASKLEKKNWSRELHHLIIKAPQEEINYQDYEYDRIQYFAYYQGKKIRNITIKQLDVFGPSIFDTARNASNWVEKMGNTVHISTNQQYIKNNLIISSGEQIDPYILANNERILRNITSLHDVRFIIIPVDGFSNQVDVLVLTKDVMAYGLAWQIFDVGYGNASLWNTNILGLGHKLQYTAYYNFNEAPKYGYAINYTIPNISNSFARLSLSHTNRKDLLESTIRFERDFLTPSMRLGGGGGYEKIKRIFDLETIDTIIPNVLTHHEYYDLWGGYSLPIKKFNRIKTRENLFLTARAQNYSFTERPLIKEDYLYDFFNRDIYLASFGLIWQGYYTTRQVYGFGQTEDLPFGAMIKFTAGYETNEFYSRPYFGSTITVAKQFNNIGYYTSTIDIGGYYRNKVEQGAINYNISYISPLIGTERHEFRNFLTIDYLEGINRFDDEFTFIEDQTGIRGINTTKLKGNKRLYLNNEIVYYSPHYIYGFRFVYFSFLDAGIINQSKEALFNNPIYTNLGIGCRIRNERLVFNTVQIQFIFFPTAPYLSNTDKEYFQIDGYPQYRQPDFSKRKPQIIEF